MNGQVKYFVAGLLLGVVSTISAALLAGPTVNVTSTEGPSEAGRFCFQSHMDNGKGTYAVLDTESGMVRLFNGEGSITMSEAPQDSSAPSE